MVETVSVVAANPYPDSGGTRLHVLFHAEEPPGDLLDRDAFGNCSRKPFWVAMRASPAFLEMERAGFRFDADKARELTASYQAALSVLDEALSYGNAQAESADAQVFRACCQVALFSQEAYWRKATGVACPPQTQSLLEAQRDAGWAHLQAWKAAGVPAAQAVVLVVAAGKP